MLKAVKPPNSNSKMITRFIALLLGLRCNRILVAPIEPRLFKIAHFAPDRHDGFFSAVPAMHSPGFSQIPPGSPQCPPVPRG